VFIELTDHLRCPAPHDEAFLVLVPYEMNGRAVWRGVLGCPICQREYRISQGVAVFELYGRTGHPAEVPPSDAPDRVDAGAIVAFLGLEGPGGYVGLFGSADRFAATLPAAVPGVHLVALNPREGMSGSETLSVLRGPNAPLKTGSLRGVVLGAGAAPDLQWQREAARVTLPGLRIVGEGGSPASTEVEVMGTADGWWVARRKG
jgi:hypothetical protein